MGTWNAYGNQYWPAHYFVDARGHVRYAHFGEGDYGHSEAVDPRAAAGGGQTGRARRRPAHTGSQPSAACHDAGELPRLRARRALRERHDPPRPPGLRRRAGAAAETARLRRHLDVAAQTATAGPGRRCSCASARAASSSCSARPAVPRRVRVLLDGRPIPTRSAGADVHGGVATSPASGCTTSSTCRPSARTCCGWSRSRECRAMRSLSDEPAAGASVMISDAMPQGSRGTVLVVDDERDDRRGRRALPRARGLRDARGVRRAGRAGGGAPGAA